MSAANAAAWQQTETALRDIFARRWYTNHGPAAQSLERRLAGLLDAGEILVTANAGIGLIMMLEGLGLQGEVVLSGLAHPRCVPALQFTGLQPVFCDVDPQTGHMTPAAAAASMTPRTAAILASNRWGGACDIVGLAAVADRFGVPLLLESSEGFGCLREGPGRGQMELFAFDDVGIVHGANGACVVTDDASLASRLRNIRSSYGAGPPVAVVRTANGRMSEAQAAFAALGLDNYQANLAHAIALHQAYRDGLAGTPGCQVLAPPGVTASNHQTTICLVEPGSDAIPMLLHRHGAAPVAALSPPGLPDVDRFATRAWAMPMGNRLSVDAVKRLCRAIQTARPGG